MKRLLAILLCLATVLTCGALTASAASKEEQQQALVQTALAFYYHNPYMQYDSAKLTDASRSKGGSVRSNNYITPEDATAERDVYTVCSSFCYEVYWNALNYKLMGDPINSDTEKLFDNCPEEMAVLKWVSTDPMTPAEVVEKVRSAMTPGDVFVWRTEKDTGHAMFFAGNVDGDGKNYIIHSTSTGGGKFDLSTGADKVEVNGDIAKDDVEETLFNPESGSYIGKKTGFVVMRPLQADAASCAITPAAAARVKTPGLGIERTTDVGFYRSPVSGGEMTYNIKITNHGKAALTVPVTETVPAGTELAKADGAKVDGKNLSWSVAVAPEETKAVAYTVKITAKAGETITCGGGSVAGIPSNTLVHNVSGKPVDEAKVKDYEKYKDVLKAGTKDGVSFAKTFYEKVLGLAWTLPETSRKIYNQAFTAFKGASGNATLKETQTELAGKMLVRSFIGGTSYCCNDTNDRVLNPHLTDLQPGDIVLIGAFCFVDKDTASYIWTGDKLITMENGKFKEWSDPLKLLCQSQFVALRPTQAYDDLSAVKAEVKLPFTDVKEGDWYYEFVKELYEKGIVNGMTDTTFVPNGKLTYGQALKLIVCGLGKGEQATTGAHWASGYLTFAKNQKWLDADVDLNGPISRLAFCQIAAKAKNLTAQPASNPFKDCADKDVLALVNAGIINGMSADTFAPDNTLTRAQISKIISGLIK